MKYDGVNSALVTVNGEEVNVEKQAKDVCRIPSKAGDNIVIDFTQTATGIAATDEEKRNDGKIYDLNGRRVYNPTEGIYIKKGKKIFVK